MHSLILHFLLQPFEWLTIEKKRNMQKLFFFLFLVSFIFGYFAFQATPCKKDSRRES